MWRYQSTDELYHHGVLGMRWGHRKAQHKTFNNRRLMRAYKKQSNDAADLRKHGYIKEANAVQKVANKSKAKAIASQQKYDAKQKNNKNLKITKGSSKAIDKYFDETAKNAKIRRLGYVSKIAGIVLTDSARNQYNGTIGRIVSVNTRNAIQGKAIAGKALNSIGNIAITGSLIKQYRDYKKYW